MSNRLKRVLMVGPYFFPATCYGGPVWTMKDLSRGLVGRGIDVEIVTTSANEPKDDPPRVEEIDGVVIRYERRWPGSRWFFSPGLARTIVARAPHFDILHIHGIWVWPTLVACAASRWFRIPYMLVPHGTLEPWALSQKALKKKVYLKLLEMSNLRHAAAVHCLTTREEKQVLALVPGAKCHVIPNAVTIAPSMLSDKGRLAFFARFPILRGKRVVLFLSRLHKKKGLDLLVPAFARVWAKDHRAHLLIAGPNEAGYQSEVEKMVAQERLEEHVTFTGLLNGEDKLAAFDAAEVFVLPSYSEGLPVVVLEAMAMGRPVVITDQCNLTEEVTRYGAGKVVENTTMSIADGIYSMLNDKIGADEMGRRGMQLIEDRFTLDAVTNRLVQIFEAAARCGRQNNTLGNPKTGD